MTTEMNEKERASVLYVVASVPWLLLRLSRSLLRMKRQAVKAEKEFYLTLQANGVPRSEAKALAAEYVSVLTFSFWVRQTLSSSASGGRKRNKK
jgi:hypothetical protein